MPPKIVGHRGARGEMPENSLEGCLYLQALGIQRVEIDAHISRDGQIIIIHDATLNRTSNGTGFVYKRKAKALTKLNLTHSIKDWTYPAHIPTLATLLNHWPDLKSMQLELKKIPMHQLPDLVTRLSEIHEEYKPSKKIILTSQFPYILSFLNEKKLPYEKGLVNVPRETDHFKMAKTLGCRYLISHHSLCNQTYLNKAHKKGFKVSTWTVNDYALYAQLKKRKHLSSIITDYPSEMMGWERL